MEQLLTTKLHIPSIRPKFVHRSRLIEQLNAGLHRKLTLISAPAGFGKTTLVSEWVAKLRLDAPNKNELVNKIAWLSLDESDNDLARFLAYLIGALNRAESSETTLGQGALDLLQAPQLPPTDVVMTSLINDVAAVKDKVVLVLDDYHVIETQSIHDAISLLLEHQPPQLQLVITTRVDPPLPMARLRARGQLTELRAVNLRFNEKDAAKFLNQAMELNLSKTDIEALATRTEGWIAGLQLAAISIRGSTDIAGLIHSFTGSHHFILDYLMEEVLEQQSEFVQRFLLQTAILDRFTGSLCNALTGRDDGQTTLEMLDHANLFIVPLDEVQDWYRYHHLFADLLRQRLHRSQPESVPILHNLASKWFEGQGLNDEAIDHALRAQDFERAAQQIERVAEREFVQGEDSKLRRWLEELPIEAVFSLPKLCVLQAWYLLASGNLNEAERFLNKAALVLDSTQEFENESGLPKRGKPLPLNHLSLRGRIAVTRAFAAFYRGDIAGIIEHARNALDDLPEQDLSWRSTATHVLGDAYDIQGDIKEGYRYRLNGLEASKATGNSFLIMIASLKLAINLRHQGRLQQVTEICTQQWARAKADGLQNTVIARWLLGIWSEVLAELNDLEEAKRLGEKGAELTSRSGDLAMLAWSHICLIRVLFSSRDRNGAEAVIANLQNIARQNFVPPWMMNHASAWQVRLWLAEGKLAPASQWAEERLLNPDGAVTSPHVLEYIVLARILIAQGQLDNATNLLLRLDDAAEAGGFTSRRIEILNLLALAAYAGMDQSQALSWLEKALTLAEPGEFIQIFVDEGPPIARLLFELRSHEIFADYVRRLLAAFPSAEPEDLDPAKSHAPQSKLIEPLSEREIEVIQLMAEGLTNIEIGARLFISLNTVKSHSRNIYGKLGVKNRTQAVAKAKGFGFL